MVHEDLRFKKITKPHRPLPKNQVALFVGADGAFYGKDGSNDPVALGAAGGGGGGGVTNVIVAGVSTTLTEAQSGSLIINHGNSFSSTATLPESPAIGTAFKFYVLHDLGFQLLASGSDIFDGLNVNALDATDEISSLEVTYIAEGVWAMQNNVGFTVPA